MSMQDLVHQTLGQYRIDAPLDAGGMGQVFRGTHIYLGRPAAIKVMRPHLATDKKFRERFLQEARSAAALKHPNILDIYEFGEQDGCLYLVMELMTGGSLRSLLQRSRDQTRPLALGLELVRQAAEGLAAAHSAQVIHRDIKPDNLLLNPVAAPPHPYAAYQLKISDFGLARLAEGQGLTGTDGMMGTLAYMSPEQFLNGHVDGRSDLYSLGVVLYEVVTGYLPFKIEHAVDAYEKHTKMEPLAPSKARSDLPPMLDDIVLHCLAKKPEERYQNGTALARVLQQVIADLDHNELTAHMTLPFVGEAKPTVMQSQMSGTMAFPPVASLPGSTTSTEVQIRVLDQQGQTLQICPMVATGQPLIIGRQADSGLVLDGDQISRQHVRVTWDGERVLVADLGSSNGSRLDNKRLLPQESTVWEKKKLLRLGRYWLRLEGRSESGAVNTSYPLGGKGTAPNTMQTVSPRTAIVSSVGVSERIGINVEPRTLMLMLGQTASVRVILTNTGPLVDWFTLSVEGVPAEWVTLHEDSVQLNPGMQREVGISVLVPRTAKYRAQEYKALIRVTSREDPSESALARILWTVQPFTQDSLAIEPKRVRGRGRARYQLLLSNEGNIPAQYALRGNDDEQRIDYQFQPDHIELEPGTERRIPLQVQLKKHWIGRPQHYPFHIDALSAGSRSKVVSSTGEFINQPVLPAWLLSTVGIVLVGGLVLASLTGLLPFPSKAKSIGTPTAVVRTGTPGLTLNAKITPTSAATPSPEATPTPTTAPTTNPSPTPVPPSLPAKSTTPLIPGLSGAIGSQYLASQDRLYFTEYTGNLSVVDNASSTNPNYHVIGTGYTQPEDVKVTADGNTAYVTERSGDIVSVNLSNPDRSQATVITPGLTAPHQLALDEVHGLLYVVEYTNPGRLLRIDLNNGDQVTPILNTLQSAIGVLISPDASAAYVTEQLPTGGQLVRFDLNTGNSVVLATSATAALFDLTWANANDTALLVTERDPTNKVWYVNLKQTPATLQLVASVAFRPSSVVSISPNSLFPLLVCSDSVIDKIS